MATRKKAQASKKAGQPAKAPGARRVPVRASKKAASAAKTTAHSARQPLASKVSGRKKSAAPASKNRGLMIFGIVAAVIVVLALVAKLRQGPPVKLLPVVVQATYQVADGSVGSLASPRGIAVDAAGNVYVADLGNQRVVKFSPDGQTASTWGQKGTAAGEFNEPSGVATDAQGNVYVADTWNGRIQKFSSQGEYYGEIASKTGNFYSPRNVCVDTRGFIFVADTGNSCVKKFDVDASLVKRWGEYGTGRERFQETFGIAVDGKNQVYVGDAGNRKIKIYSGEGKYLRDQRVKGWQGGVSWPMLAVDSVGRIYATDVQHNLVWIYSPEGKYLGSWGNQPGKEIFASPLGIAVGPEDSVYVSNMTRGEIVKLQGVAGK